MSPAIPILAAVALVALFSGASSAAPAPVPPDEGPPPGPPPGPGPAPGAPKGGTGPIDPGDDGGGLSIRERAIRDECEGKARFALDSGEPAVLIQVADEIEANCPDLAKVLRETADAGDPWGYW